MKCSTNPEIKPNRRPASKHAQTPGKPVNNRNCIPHFYKNNKTVTMFIKIPTKTHIEHRDYADAHKFTQNKDTHMPNHTRTQINNIHHFYEGPYSPNINTNTHNT